MHAALVLTLFSPRSGAIVMEKGRSFGPAKDYTLANTTARFVEFETAVDLKTAVENLDNQDFKGTKVHCYADVSHCYSLHL